MKWPNKSLQRTFDLPPIFAAAKTGVASNAAELRLLEKELDPQEVDKFSGRIDGPFEIWGYYYRPRLGEHEAVAVEGYIEGYNTLMRKEYKRKEAERINRYERKRRTPKY